MVQSQPMSRGKGQGILLLGFAVWFVIGAGGCVSSETHQKTLDELGKLKEESARQAKAEKGRFAEELSALERDKTRAMNERLEAQTALAQAEAELAGAREAVQQEQSRGRVLRDDLIAMEEKTQQVEDLAGEVRRERDQLQTKSDDLQRKLDTTRQELDMNKDVLNDTMVRLGELGKVHEELKGALGKAEGDIRDLKTQLQAEKAQVIGLREDKQNLLGGTATAQSEIARLQKRAGELETDAARVRELEQQLGERNQEIGQLRQSVADREAVAASLALQTQELAKAKERVDQLMAELATMSEDLAGVKRERDGLTEKAAVLTETAAKLEQDRAQTMASLEARQKDLKLLEQEKAEKEAEIKRLTGTYQDLESSLRSEIARGDIKIKQVRDRLTINVVDRILFDSGSAKIKPEGLKVLKTVGGVLKGVLDKQIRIDGHTDNVPISARLQDRFKTNWELSTARATSVVRYLIDEAAIAPNLLTAAGHADTQPEAGNDSEEGRTQNRRIEIALYPKDLGGIAESMEPER